MSRFKRKIIKKKVSKSNKIPKVMHPDVNAIIWYVINKSNNAVNGQNATGWIKISRRDMSRKTNVKYEVVKRIFRSLIKSDLLYRKVDGYSTKYSINFSKLAQAYLSGIHKVDMSRKNRSGKGKIQLGRLSSDIIYIYFNDFTMGNLDKYIIVGDNKNREELETMIVEKTKTNPYLQLAKRLSRVIRTYKKYNHSHEQLKEWSKHIEKLIHEDEVSEKRILTLLDWYRDKIGQKYIPLAMSGSTFREKFIRLEASMDRDSQEVRKEEEDPYDIIADQMKGWSKMEITRIEDAYDDSENVMSHDDYNKSLLSKNICGLAKWIVDKRPSDFEDKLHELLPPGKLISEFANWLTNETWIDVITEKTFEPGSKTFKIFVDKFSENELRHQLTTKRNVI